MGAVRNTIRGFVFMIFYVAFTIIVPFLTFTFIRNLAISEIEITLTQQSYENIIFWVVAFGLLISGCAFFTYSSPKQSIRRGVFALFQILINCMYLWSYKFSGATAVEFSFAAFDGNVILNLQQMILVYMGIYTLTILIKVYDLADFIINREKIRAKRRE